MKPEVLKSLTHLDLNHTDVKILLAIRNGYHRQERIANTIHVTQPTISRRIEALINRGLLNYTKEDGLTLPLGWTGTINKLIQEADDLNINAKQALTYLRLARFSVENGIQEGHEQAEPSDLPI